MKDYEILNKIRESGVCAIVRGTKIENACKIADALLAGGVNVIEVTFNTPGAAEMIKELSEKYKDKMVVGAGTVLDPETARVAIMAGATFVLSPSLNIDVLRMCQRYSVLPVPGITTPTEAITAWENGASVVKIFPAGALGASYIKQMRGPFSQIDMMAVGGVSLDNIKDFIKAGACSVGIGSDLVDKKLVEAGKFDELTKRASNFINAIKAARG
jgi:2-dehydro-3-deoxyphosphogluconate aldolase/(4S)-4-hydroxy-2-oxoglutarate aldolase